MVAGRYRIVGLLGSGGMGEVYRADDLKLGQAVALKFLPRKLAGDVDRLAYFHNEVRLARGVSHPNVCRVYDIGEVDGEHFISMEYVDGEDLASLLRRIGRLPSDKGVAIAQQLCAGLAAAHDLGVLHRDLKPANIMIDGRGRARITDFGLAKLADDMGRRDAGAGTPAYMAPEQLAGKPATAQSDIYALGLVLYEMFTGKRPFPAGSRAELARLQSDSTPSAPSSLVSDIDPAVERVIMRCLEPEPAERPASALSVAAALPGGDPLAAALAAGETPAPEMVAAAGERGGLDPRIGGACVAAIVVGLLVVAWLSERVILVNQGGLPLKPEVLEQKARDIVAELGYQLAQDPAADSAYGFDYNNAYLRYAHEAGLSMPAKRSHGIFFWYRQAPRTLSPVGIFGVTRSDFSRGKVRAADPPVISGGMINVSLNPEGELLEFVAVPPSDAPEAPDSEPTDWEGLFELAGLDLADFEKDSPATTPPVYVEQRQAWIGTTPDVQNPSQERCVEAGTYAGKIAYFQVVDAWDDPRYDGSLDENVGMRVFLIVSMLTLIIAVGLAASNVRHRRVDHRGAARLAIFTFSFLMLRWLSEASHRADLVHERNLFFFAFAISIFYAAAFWIIYVALEPYVRRFWPQTLISWSRLLAGRFRDPLVGRDVLVGAMFGVGWVVLQRSSEWMGLSSGEILTGMSLESLVGVRQVAGQLLQTFRYAIFVPMIVLTTFMLLRILLRNSWVAAAVVALIFTTFLASGNNASALGWIFFGLIAFSWVFLITRFGLLAFVVGIYVRFTLAEFPITTDLGAWYAGATLLAIAVVLALAGYGFYFSLAPQPLARRSQAA